MYLKFREKRLFVGMRLRDWSAVWYEPVGKADNDGTAPIGLFSSTTGMKTREPMEGEVAWLPCFEPTTFSSKVKRERIRMQQQFLYDTFRYMAEGDRANVLALNRSLDQPGYTRWQEWFKVLKAFKEDRRRRRAIREQLVRASGGEEVDYNSDEDEIPDLPEGPPPRDMNLSMRQVASDRRHRGSGVRRRRAGRGQRPSGGRLTNSSEGRIAPDSIDIAFGDSGSVGQFDDEAYFDGSTPSPDSRNPNNRDPDSQVPNGEGFNNQGQNDASPMREDSNEGNLNNEVELPDIDDIVNRHHKGRGGHSSGN